MVSSSNGLFYYLNLLHNRVIKLLLGRLFYSSHEEWYLFVISQLIPFVIIYDCNFVA